MSAGAASLLAETVAREAYGRLVALLARRSGDLAGAEDALSDALLAALERWPVDGPPANPQGWLLTAARRRQIDGARRRGRADAAQADLLRLQEEIVALSEPPPLPDARLGLMMACAHPAVDSHARTPLMLQAVLGLTAERMASTFLVSPAAMTKRLVRAKARLAPTGVRFEAPGPEALTGRLEPVLEAIYAAFSLGRDDATTGGGESLDDEAVWLGRLVERLTEGEPEAAGLLALMLFASARTPAAAGAFVPLSEQDCAAWDGAAMEEAEELLRRAGRAGRPGRFQLEAAIQAVHADRRRSGRTDWDAILILYEGLATLAPTVGGQVSHAAALAQAARPTQALEKLNALEPTAIAAHQPFWATLAFTLARLQRPAEAADAYFRAAGLSDRAPVRAWLLARRAALES